MFDFENNDIILQENGTFKSTTVDNQNCALISLSQVCRITRPILGAQIGSRLINRQRRHVSSILSSAKRMVQDDGGKNVVVDFDLNENLIFIAEYDS